MSEKQACYFCGSTHAIEQHHIIPNYIDQNASEEKVPLCAECHNKFHTLLYKILEKSPRIKKRAEEDAWANNYDPRKDYPTEEAEVLNFIHEHQPIGNQEITDTFGIRSMVTNQLSHKGLIEFNVSTRTWHVSSKGLYGLLLKKEGEEH